MDSDSSDRNKLHIHYLTAYLRHGFGSRCAFLRFKRVLL